MFKKILLVFTGRINRNSIHPSCKKYSCRSTAKLYRQMFLLLPADVKSILAKACNDCHSNNTRYPWYSKDSAGTLVAGQPYQRTEKRN